MDPGRENMFDVIRQFYVLPTYNNFSLQFVTPILTINYEDLFVKDSLIEIKHFNLNKRVNGIK